MKLPCGCCEGTHAVTPQPTANRPGLNALAYRVGTHATFLETMKARLSSRDYPQLAGLKTRDAGDPAITLLDGWATVADVLTFYQERIVNEGYLRTATERRSILELARLVGYVPRPGVSASVYLAYTLEDTSDPVEIPAGARAQSLPGPGELPQSFETSEPLKARAMWNNLKPRMTQPQVIEQAGTGINKDTIYFDGAATNLKANDALLFVFDGATTILRHVRTVEVQFADKRTKVILQEKLPVPAPLAIRKRENDLSPLETLQTLVKPLSLSPSLQPANSLHLSRSSSQSFADDRDTLPQLLSVFQPRIAETVYKAWANTMVTQPAKVEVYALRLTAPLFGHNAPKRILAINRDTGQITSVGEWQIVEMVKEKPVHREEEKAIYLDTKYDKILPDTWVVIDTTSVYEVAHKDETVFANLSPTSKIVIFKAQSVRTSVARAEYGLSGATTQIEMSSSWIKYNTTSPNPERVPEIDHEFELIRRTVVSTQSELLPLAEEPIEDNVEGDRVKLGALYDGLQSGRWVIVSGERTDIKDANGIVVPGVKASELVMLAGVTQDFDPKLLGDKVHTTLILANEGLKYTYKRETVTIYGNVVKATHGETRNEVLGSGDGSRTLQSFTLKQPPLTYVSASIPAGVASTLLLRVNTVEWHEADSLAGLGPNDRNFITRTDDEAKTTVVSGNGQQGARLPTGVENITSVYRNGIGKDGNVKAEQISLLTTRPLGVKAVINPLRASGGANKESRDQARRNTPLAVMALDRLISTEDYAAFARTFAGIGKASARRLSDGHRQLVHLTIAGADDIPIDQNSDLYRNLRRALRDYGDPYLPIAVAVRELLALVISANVRVLPDYQWESVATYIRTALLEAFSFERGELGQSVSLSEVTSVIQQVKGVAYVDVDVLESFSETEIANAELLKAKLKQLQDAAKPENSIRAEVARVAADKRILPAQLAYLTPDVKDTLILNEVKS